jgi:hypothetical protein
MKAYTPIYDSNRFPRMMKRPDGTYGCRGCGRDIPKGRQAWCSRECCRKYHPAYVVQEVKKRDKGICQLCSEDLKQLEAEWWKQKPDYLKVGWKAQEEWVRNKPRANFDHIVPFSEGGLTVLENMRTLCEPCHRKRTRQWHKERKQADNPQLAFAQ